jgi:predicted MPP superfamily phosphohydrolase
MIILPIFLNREENLLVKLDWGLPQYLFLSLIYGITVKYNYKVIKQRIFFPDLPGHLMVLPSLKSQIYSGSFNPDKIKYAIDLVNEQNSDLMLFTGDIVNTDAKMHPWIEAFNGIKNTNMESFLFWEP